MENKNVSETVEKNISSGEKSDEISLLDLFSVVLKYIKMEVAIVACAMVFAVLISIVSIMLPPEKSFLPNKYTSKANMLINESNSKNSALSAALSSSTLSGLLGINASAGSSYSSLAIYLAGSNPLLDAIVENFKILEREEFEKAKHPLSDSRKWIKEKLSASSDDESGVFTISFTDIDPLFAQEVVNFSVDWISNRFDELGVDKNKIQKANLEKNIESSFAEIQRLQRQVENVGHSVASGSSVYSSISLTTTKIQMELTAQQEVYKQIKTQYELLKIQMASESPVFQILERPEVPDMKSSPSRGKLCIIITFAAVFIALFIAFLRNAVENIKNDPDAISKLKFTKKNK